MAWTGPLNGHKRRRLGVPPANPSVSDHGTRTQEHDLELRTILNGLHVPHHILRRLEIRLLLLKQEVGDRGKEIKFLDRKLKQRTSDLEDEKRNLYYERSVARRTKRAVVEQRRQLGTRADVYAKLTRSSEGKVIDLEKCLLLQNQLLDVGTIAVREKRLEIEKLKLQIGKQEKVLHDKDNIIELLNDNILQMQVASCDQLMDLALEFQAQRTLGMIGGLREDIAAKESTIQSLKVALTERDARIAAHNSIAAEQEARIDALQRENDGHATVIAELENLLVLQAHPARGSAGH